ncbi:alpha/beta fold hydrolase [Suttonella ornithocola]|uniref:Tropinesterase n=1 Tax=Suttonella ornithocola TaxID=279832 RepID=A0A380MZT6_9GAMM|nr:alpha/beta hydrolase [Suttonella ornithocola]SUO97393.1 Tropinesterase [Suttonella ornithocola]
MSLKWKEIIVDLPHIRLAGIHYGEGRHSVLALHGWLDNAESFRPLAEKLCNDDVSIIALDFAGHGHSGHRPLGSGYHFSDYLRDILMAADLLGLGSLDLLCHSMGAAAGTLIAGAFPQRVARMICIELYGVGSISDHEPLPKRFRESLLSLDYVSARPAKAHLDFSALVKARLQAGEMLEESAKLLLSRNTSLTADGYRFLSDRRLRQWQPSLLSEAQMMSFIREITAPVLVIEGEDGFARQWKFLSPRYEETRDIEIMRLPGGHHLHMDDAANVAKTIQAFWENKPLTGLSQ